jgi:hypothetical protein
MLGSGTEQIKKSKEGVLQYCDTSKIVANILTKAIGAPRFEQLRTLWGVRVASE